MLSAELIPLEFEGFLVEAGQDVNNTPDIWKYAVELLLIDTECERVVETRQDGDVLHIIVQTRTGVKKSVVRPAMSEAFEQELLEWVREIHRDRETQFVQAQSSP